MLKIPFQRLNNSWPLVRINQPAWIVHKTLIGMSHLTCGLACLQGAEGLKAIDTNLCKQKYWGKTVKMLFGLCPYTSARAVAPCAELSDFFFFSFFFPPFNQHGVGILHLLHGRVSHHFQLLHEDRHRVQAQTQDLRAKHTRGERTGGLRIFPGTLCALHLQIGGGLFQPDSEKRQENPHSCWLSGPDGHCSIFGGRTVLNETGQQAVGLFLMWAETGWKPHRILDYIISSIFFTTALIVGVSLASEVTLALQTTNNWGKMNDLMDEGVFFHSVDCRSIPTEVERGSQKALLNQSINQCKDRVKVYLVFINDEIKPQILFCKWRAYIYKL